MCDPRVHSLVVEIRDLYVRTCELADEINGRHELENRKIVDGPMPGSPERIPELQYFRTAADQHNALRRAREDPAILRRSKLVQWVLWFVVFGGGLALQWWTDSLLSLIGLAITVLLIMGLVEQRLPWFVMPVRRHLRWQLTELGVPICVECGYDMRGCTGGRCSECGAAVANPFLHATKEQIRA